MFSTNSQQTDQLDEAGRRVLRAAAASLEETEAAASSPFLLTRIRAAIREEAARREESGGWLSLIFVARRAVPAMALVTLMAGALTAWSAFNPPVAQTSVDDEAIVEGPGPGVEQTVLAGATLSQDDVINIVVDREYGRNGR
jgi:hypothetical protein